MITKTVKSSLEVAISSILTFILTLFFSLIGSALGGFLSYIILKKAKSEEIKSFKDAVMLLALIALLSTLLLLLTSTFFIKMPDTPVGQFLRIDELTSYGKEESSIIFVVQLVLSVLNISSFMLFAYFASRITK